MSRSGSRSRRQALVALIVVAAVYLAAALTLAEPTRGLESDEATYVSQVNGRAPAAPFEAHRARGITWLVAPVAARTADVVVLRVYLAVVSALALVLAFRPWTRILRPPAAPIAAFVFAGTWVSVYYAAEVSPNLYVAFGAVAACGYAALALSGAGRSPLIGLATSVAVVAVMRPTDALWLALPLGVAALASPRRVPVGAGLVGGLVAGWAPWVVESLISFSGPVERLRAAAELSRSALRWTLPLHLRVLDGNLICCFGPDRQPVVGVGAYVWFTALVVLSVAGAVVAARRAERSAVTLALAAGLALAVPYLALTAFVIVRFLLPVHALLAIPVGVAFAAILRWAAARAVPEAGGALLVGAALTYATFLAWQVGVLTAVADEQAIARGGAVDAARLAHDIGVVPPCFVLGARAPAIAFELGCSTAGVGREAHLRSVVAATEHAAAGEAVAVFWRGRLPEGAFAHEWQAVPVDGRHPGWVVYLPPDFRLKRGYASDAGSSTR